MSTQINTGKRDRIKFYEPSRLRSDPFSSCSSPSDRKQAFDILRLFRLRPTETSYMK